MGVDGPEPGPPAGEVGFHRVDREVEHGVDLLQGLVEHVLEDHHAALHRRKLDEPRHRRLDLTPTGSGLTGSATAWAASMDSLARIARLRNRSSARLWAIRNSQGRSGGTSSNSSRATRARAKVSCTTSSPSITEPIRRAQ